MPQPTRIRSALSRSALFRSALTLSALTPLPLAVSPAAAQTPYPSRPVEVIVPYSAGGSVDIMARAFSKEMAEILGQHIVVNNRDGAGGTIGVAAIANGRPDGYTVLFSPSSPLTPGLMSRSTSRTSSTSAPPFSSSAMTTLARASVEDDWGEGLRVQFRTTARMVFSGLRIAPTIRAATAFRYFI